MAHDNISNEGILAIDGAANSPGGARLQVCTDAVRSSLVADELHEPSGIWSQRTNCIGAARQFAAVAAEQGFSIEYALVRAYPWQQSANSREIHITAIAQDNTTNRRFFADPMPLSGYLYGQTGEVASVHNRDSTREYLEYQDRSLGGRVLLQVLTEDELNAAIVATLAKDRVKQGDTSSAHELAMLALKSLDAVQSYQAMALAALEETDVSLKGLVNNQVPATAIRTSHRRLLSPERDAKVVELLERERRVREQFGARAAMLTRGHRTFAPLNYWSSVDISLNRGFDTLYLNPVSMLSWKDFSSSSQPILRYEQNMLQYPGFSKSSLYTHHLSEDS